MSHDCDNSVSQTDDDTEPSNPYTPLHLDPGDYMDQLDDFEMSEAQKHEALSALWHIMRMLVDIGFGADSIHFVLPYLLKKTSQDSGKLVDRKHSKTQTPYAMKGNIHD